MGEDRTNAPRPWSVADGVFARELLGVKDAFIEQFWRERSEREEQSPPRGAAITEADVFADSSGSGVELGLPDTDLGVVVRTDFSDDEVWRGVAREVLQGQSTFPGPLERATVRVTGGSDGAEDTLVVVQDEDDPSLMVLGDRRFDGMTPERVHQLMGEGQVIFLADSVTMTHPEHVLLALRAPFEPDEDAQEGFRLTPGSVDGAAAMLQVGKLLWKELLEQRDADGVLRRG